MASPRPAPPVPRSRLSSRRMKGSKILSRSLAGMPAVIVDDQFVGAVRASGQGYMHQAAGIAYRVLHQVEQRPAHVAAVQADLRRAIAVHYATHGARLRQVVDLRQRVAEPVARVDGFLRHHVVRRPFQTRVDQQFRHHAFQLVDVRLHVLQDMLGARRCGPAAAGRLRRPAGPAACAVHARRRWSGCADSRSARRCARPSD